MRIVLARDGVDALVSLHAKRCNPAKFNRFSKTISSCYSLLLGRFAAAGGCGFGQLVECVKIEPALFTQLVFDKKISTGAFRLWHYFLNRQGRNECCWPSLQLICSDIGCSKNSLSGWIHELESRGYIYVTRGTQRVPNSYSVSGTVQYHKEPSCGIVLTPSGTDLTSLDTPKQGHELIIREFIKGTNTIFPSSYEATEPKENHNPEEGF